MSNSVLAQADIDAMMSAGPSATPSADPPATAVVASQPDAAAAPQQAAPVPKPRAREMAIAPNATHTASIPARAVAATPNPAASAEAKALRQALASIAEDLGTMRVALHRALAEGDQFRDQLRDQRAEIDSLRAEFGARSLSPGVRKSRRRIDPIWSAEVYLALPATK